MRYSRMGYLVKGFYKMADLAIKEINMSKSAKVTESTKTTKPAKTKRTIIDFYKKHGMGPTLDAFACSHSTFYLWQSLYHRYGINGLRDKVIV